MAPGDHQVPYNDLNIGGRKHIFSLNLLAILDTIIRGRLNTPWATSQDHALQYRSGTTYLTSFTSITHMTAYQNPQIALKSETQQGLTLLLVGTGSTRWYAALLARFMTMSTHG